MKRCVKLNKDDVQKIIAKYFEVPEKNVDIDAGIEEAGYGMQTYNVPYVYITITLSDIDL